MPNFQTFIFVREREYPASPISSQSGRSIIFPSTPRDPLNSSFTFIFSLHQILFTDPRPPAPKLLIFVLTKSPLPHFLPRQNQKMTSNSLTSLCQHHSVISGRLLSSDSTATPPSSFFLKFPSPTTTPPFITTAAATTTTAFSLSSTTSSSAAASTSQPVSLDLLRHHLAAKNFRQADEETRGLLILLAGEPAQKRGYIFFSEVQFISAADLKAIDDLWREHSDNKFGYSVQRKIWKKSNRDFTKLFMKLGWMKKLETEVEQYNYRAFPDEFLWELNGETPEGHLPLTNALRGTQLFGSILTHPAFEAEEEEEEEALKTVGGSKPLTNGVVKPDYTF